MTREQIGDWIQLIQISLDQKHVCDQKQIAQIRLDRDKFVIFQFDLMQKTRNRSDHPRLRKLPKTVKNITIFQYFWELAQPREIRFISCLFVLFSHLETRVKSTHTHTLYFEEIFVWPCKGGSTILHGNRAVRNQGRSHF